MAYMIVMLAGLGLPIGAGSGVSRHWGPACGWIVALAGIAIAVAMLGLPLHVLQSGACRDADDFQLCMEGPD